MPTPSSRSTSEQHHQIQQQQQPPSPSQSGSQPSCPEDHHPSQSSRETTAAIPAASAMNINDTPDSTASSPASPTSPQSNSAFRYGFDPDGLPSPPRIPPLSSPTMPSDASNLRSPSYTPMSPNDAIGFGQPFGSSASASRSTTMSPRPHSRGISTGFASGESNAATSPAADDEDDDESKPMDVEDCSPGPSQTRSRIFRWSDPEPNDDWDHLDDSILDTDWNEYSSQSPALSHGFTSMRVVPISSSSYLRPGSRFKGTQTSERSIYNVDVEIKHVDMRESFLCGYLHIEGLTQDNPSICTYFEGEIIGPKYGFLTKHASWGADESTDLSHWQKFGAFRPYYRSLKKGVIREVDFSQKDNIFMRWKEHFLVPDHRKNSIPGASFEGFYYICFNQVRGEVMGIYFHHNSEKFQQLELNHVENRGRFGAIEFR